MPTPTTPAAAAPWPTRWTSRSGSGRSTPPTSSRGTPSPPSRSSAPLLRRLSPYPGTPVARQLREGDELGHGFTVLETPGHSAGHVAFLARARPRAASPATCSSTCASRRCAPACASRRPADHRPRAQPRLRAPSGRARARARPVRPRPPRCATRPKLPRVHGVAAERPEESRPTAPA
jgi:hypothetical protein